MKCVSFPHKFPNVHPINRLIFCILILSFHRYQTNTSNTMLSNIVDIQPKDAGGGGGETREAVVYRLADDMLEKLPQDYIPHEVTTLRQWYKASAQHLHILFCVQFNIFPLKIFSLILILREKNDLFFILKDKHKSGSPNHVLYAIQYIPSEIIFTCFDI